MWKLDLKSDEAVKKENKRIFKRVRGPSGTAYKGVPNRIHFLPHFFEIKQEAFIHRAIAPCTCKVECKVALNDKIYMLTYIQKVVNIDKQTGDEFNKELKKAIPEKISNIDIMRINENLQYISEAQACIEKQKNDIEKK